MNKGENFDEKQDIFMGITTDSLLGGELDILSR